MRSPTSSLRALVAGCAVAALLGVGLAAVPSGAAPADQACERRNNNTYAKLLECVRLAGVLEHQQEFQAIADANGGTRADQTPGYLASVDYVVDVLEDAGWDADVVPFTYPGVDGALEQLTPVALTHPVGTRITGTAEGEVTGPVVPVDLSLADPAASSSGCETDDFVGLDFAGPSDIALIQRGTCPFEVKVDNAEAAGAEAVILFNTGTEGNTGVLDNITLGVQQSVPVVGASFAAGESLAQPGTTARVLVDFVDRTSYNVIGELAGRNAGNVVMAGAHLDSVPAGPGINDNGSGSATLLEVAQVLGNHKPENTVRFAWWGAEELGLIGSTQWVAQQVQADTLDEVALYLNFDMVGSPNYIFMVYDANESSFNAPPGVTIPEGSEAIETTFESFYTLRGEPYDDTQFSGRSDYQAFINNGIPSSGLFTGAEGIKSPLQQTIWGGTAGAQFDPCYHQGCDTIDNLDHHALEVNSDAVAFAVLTYAYSTEDVNGVRGKKVPGNFTIPEPDGPRHTFAGPLGGDGGHDHDPVTR